MVDILNLFNSLKNLIGNISQLRKANIKYHIKLAFTLFTITLLASIILPKDDTPYIKILVILFLFTLLIHTFNNNHKTLSDITHSAPNYHSDLKNIYSIIEPQANEKNKEKLKSESIIRIIGTNKSGKKTFENQFITPTLRECDPTLTILQDRPKTTLDPEKSYIIKNVTSGSQMWSTDPSSVKKLILISNENPTIPPSSDSTIKLSPELDNPDAALKRMLNNSCIQAIPEKNLTELLTHCASEIHKRNSKQNVYHCFTIVTKACIDSNSRVIFLTASLLEALKNENLNTKDLVERISTQTRRRANIISFSILFFTILVLLSATIIPRQQTHKKTAPIHLQPQGLSLKTKTPDHFPITPRTFYSGTQSTLETLQTLPDTLEHISLSNPLIRDLTILKKFKKLKILELYELNIIDTRVPFENLPQLHTFTLTDQKTFNWENIDGLHQASIRTLTATVDSPASAQAIGLFQNLTSLTIHTRKSKDIISKEQQEKINQNLSLTLKTLPHLRELNLFGSFGPLEMLLGEDRSRIASLSLQHYNDSFSDNTLRDFTSLKHLSISTCRHTLNLSDIYKLPIISTLKLDNLSLYIPSALAPNPTITSLELTKITFTQLSSNKILDKAIFRLFPNLKNVSLDPLSNTESHNWLSKFSNLDTLKIKGGHLHLPQEKRITARVAVLENSCMKTLFSLSPEKINSLSLHNILIKSSCQTENIQYENSITNLIELYLDENIPKSLSQKLLDNNNLLKLSIPLNELSAKKQSPLQLTHLNLRYGNGSTIFGYNYSDPTLFPKLQHLYFTNTNSFTALPTNIPYENMKDIDFLYFNFNNEHFEFPRESTNRRY